MPYARKTALTGMILAAAASRFFPHPPNLTAVAAIALLGGAVLVETIFAIPGLGQTLVNALASRDLPLVQGAVLLGAGLYVGAQLLVEWTQALLDPRLR